MQDCYSYKYVYTNELLPTKDLFALIPAENAIYVENEANYKFKNMQKEYASNKNHLSGSMVTPVSIS
jgi:hypothetical protein